MASDSGAKLYDYLKIKHVGLDKICRHMGDLEIPSCVFKVNSLSYQFVFFDSYKTENRHAIDRILICVK